MSAFFLIPLRNIIQLLWIFPLFIFSTTIGHAAVQKPTVLLTIPKAGTGLFEKAVSAITGHSLFIAGTAYLSTDEHVKDILQGNHYLYLAHLIDEYNVLSSLSHDQIRIVIGIRDPRDIVLSQID